jgi:hemin uptake protein HemP
MILQQPIDPRVQSPRQPEAVEARLLDSRELLRGERELLIHHHGKLYRLRLTRAGKLILTK